MRKALPTAALLEMYEADLELGVDPLAFPRTPQPPPAPFAPPFRIEKADWEAEQAERRALEEKQERQRRAEILAEELSKLEDEQPPEKPTPPASRRGRP